MIKRRIGGGVGGVQDCVYGRVEEVVSDDEETGVLHPLRYVVGSEVAAWKPARKGVHRREPTMHRRFSLKSNPMPQRVG